ncbi:MAG: clan AA aspartic protease [Treponema sp.]|jgi:clan AA aspartic protease|nr:clan AA aspartic protease [Treponema sp.]
MGHVDVQITLKNAGDVSNVQRGIITEPEIRQTTVQALVDTGATYLVINQRLLQELGLYTSGERMVSFANSTGVVCKMTEPVEIHWEDRFITMPALLVDNAEEILLGVYPLEGMDLMVDPVKQKLVGAHGDVPTCYCY